MRIPRKQSRTLTEVDQALVARPELIIDNGSDMRYNTCMSTKESMMTTKQQIVELLKTNDKAVARALVALNARQTADEQSQETVKYDNGMGFRPCHARMGTSMATFYSRNGYLSPKQVAYWRGKDKTGKMRIEIYAGQLLLVAIEKAAKEKIVAKPVGDVGNLLEEQMVLQEQLDAYQEGAMGEGPDQDAAVENFFARLHQIKEQLEEINRCEYKMARDSVL